MQICLACHQYEKTFDWPIQRNHRFVHCKLYVITIYLVGLIYLKKVWYWSLHRYILQQARQQNSTVWSCGRGRIYSSRCLAKVDRVKIRVQVSCTIMISLKKYTGVAVAWQRNLDIFEKVQSKLPETWVVKTWDWKLAEYMFNLPKQRAIILAIWQLLRSMRNTIQFRMLEFVNCRRL